MKRKYHEVLQTMRFSDSRCLELMYLLDAKGVIRWISEECEEITGFKAQELRGEFLFDYVHPMDRLNVACLWNEMHRRPTALGFRMKCKSNGWARLKGSMAILSSDEVIILTNETVDLGAVLSNQSFTKNKRLG